MYVDDNEISGPRTFHSFYSTREYAKGFYRSPSSLVGTQPFDFAFVMQHEF